MTHHEKSVKSPLNKLFIFLFFIKEHRYTGIIYASGLSHIIFTSLSYNLEALWGFFSVLNSLFKICSQFFSFILVLVQLAGNLFYYLQCDLEPL